MVVCELRKNSGIELAWDAMTEAIESARSPFIEKNMRQFFLLCLNQ